MKLLSLKSALILLLLFMVTGCQESKNNKNINDLSGFIDEPRWTLTEVIENTRNSLNTNKLEGDPEIEEDLSYITQELIDDYWANAEEKIITEQDLIDLQNVACYWGNNWVHISKTQWAYTNNNKKKGCDPVKTSVLCGSGQRWKVRVKKLAHRYCKKVKNAKMAWP